QVKGLDEYKSEILGYLRACIKICEKQTEKRKYFNDIRLKTKAKSLKNKPRKMTKIEWKFLVDHGSDDKFKEKRKKASESRVHQNMPHYNGNKSFARLRQDIISIIIYNM
ncbi:Glycolipid 2-alpha-mannosyltransferase, partial [Bienertia sinuspersici]